MITLEEAKKLSQGYKIIPISKEILSDITTPMHFYNLLQGYLYLHWQ